MTKQAIIQTILISVTASVIFEFVIKPKIEEMKNAN